MFSVCHSIQSVIFYIMQLNNVMVRDVYMVKVVFIKKTKVIFTKSNEDFKLALSWIITGNFVFEEKLLLCGLFFYGGMEDVFCPTYPHKNLIICLSIVC